MLNLIAHPGLLPAPLKYESISGEWAQRIRAITKVPVIERAPRYEASPYGYYRLTAGDGRPLFFGKVVGSGDAPRLSAAARLAEEVSSAGVAVARLQGAFQLGPDHYLFVYDWIDGAFSTGALDEVEALGRALSALHEAFRRIPASIETVWQRSRAEQWQSLEQLKKARQLDNRLLPVLVNFLDRRHEVDECFAHDMQRIHNDLHVANVLFDSTGSVVAFLDFEEALHSVSNPLMDISWVLERFCFLEKCQNKAEKLASHFISAYVSSGTRLYFDKDMLLDCMRWRSFLALALLSQRRDADTRDWNLEWDKFTFLLFQEREWGKLIKVLSRPGA